MLRLGNTLHGAQLCTARHDMCLMWPILAAQALYPVPRLLRSVALAAPPPDARLLGTRRLRCGWRTRRRCAGAAAA